MNSYNALQMALSREPQPWDIVKSKIRMSVTLLEKVEDENGGTSLKVTDNQIFNMSGKEFRVSLEQDRLAGVKHKVEIVYEKPEKFQLNGIYILADGRKAWTFTEKTN